MVLGPAENEYDLLKQIAALSFSATDRRVSPYDLIEYGKDDTQQQASDCDHWLGSLVGNGLLISSIWGTYIVTPLGWMKVWS